MRSIHLGEVKRMARTVKQLRTAGKQLLKNSVRSPSVCKSRKAKSKKETRSSKNNQGTQYSRKGLKLNRWSEEDMQKAIVEYHQKKAEGTVGLRELARAWRVPKSTLARRLKAPQLGYEHASGRPTVFDDATENELAALILDLAKRGFPLSEVQVRNLATQFADANDLQVFSQNKENHAGYYWFKGFMRRHPELCVKRAEGLSAARSGAMNKTNIEKWFVEYKQLVDKLHISDLPSHIWNLDESGLQDVFEAKRAVGKKGVPLYQVTAGEKGDTTTILPVFNAMGEIGKLMVIFKGKRIKPEWAVGSPSGTLIRASPDGWINKELFLEFCEAFVTTLVDDGRKHVLLMDGHGSHVGLYNLDAFKLLREHNVEVFCFPPHTSHWLQPADRCLFKSLKSHWTTEGLSYTRSTGGKKCGKSDFFRIFTPAWLRCSTVENIQSGFRSSGIFPVNFNAIPDMAYLPSLTSERPMPQQDESINSAALNDVSLEVNGSASTIMPSAQDPASELLSTGQSCSTVIKSIGFHQGDGDMAITGRCHTIQQPVIMQPAAEMNESVQLLDISVNYYTQQQEYEPTEFADPVESFIALLNSCNNPEVGVGLSYTFSGIAL